MIIIAIENEHRDHSSKGMNDVENRNILTYSVLKLFDVN